MHRLLQTFREMLQDEFFLPLCAIVILGYALILVILGEFRDENGVKGLMAMSPDWLKLGPESDPFVGFGANCHQYLIYLGVVEVDHEIQRTAKSAS